VPLRNYSLIFNFSLINFHDYPWTTENLTALFEPKHADLAAETRPILPWKGENQPHTVEPTDIPDRQMNLSEPSVSEHTSAVPPTPRPTTTICINRRLSQMINFRPTSRRHDSKHCSHHLELVTTWWFARNCSSWSSSADSSRKSVIVYVHHERYSYFTRCRGRMKCVYCMRRSLY